MSTSTATKTASESFVSGYVPVNGLNMYYEIHGNGEPLVLIHGGGSTIETTFGHVLDAFAKNRQVIAVELQAHGRTSDRDAPESFEQDADDVAALLQYLKIGKADIFGFSNGGSTTLKIAMRHPDLVRKIVVGSAMFKRDGMIPHFWDGLKGATLKDMPEALAIGFLKVQPDENKLLNMFEKDRDRMLAFKDWKAEDISAIKAPAFIISNDGDVILPEHAIEIWRLLPNAKLAILPGFHGSYLAEITTGMENSKIPALAVAMIEEFLDAPMQKEN